MIQLIFSVTAAAIRQMPSVTAVAIALRRLVILMGTH
jgi:hypothetical protein